MFADTPKTEFKSAGIVFLGEVLTSEPGLAEMRILENFKNAPGERITMHTPTQGSACGYWFGKPGSRHLIYGWLDAEGPAVNLCSRSREASQANCDLRYLRSRAAWWRFPLSSLRILKWLGAGGRACPLV
jgi:hypothetical protein